MPCMCMYDCIIAMHFENIMESCIFMVNTLILLANIVMQENGRIPLSPLMN